jgi:hypothetical protein
MHTMHSKRGYNRGRPRRDHYEEDDDNKDCRRNNCNYKDGDTDNNDE